MWYSFTQNACVFKYKPTVGEIIIMILHILTLGLVGRVWLIQPLQNGKPTDMKVKWLLSSPFDKTTKEK